MVLWFIGMSGAGKTKLSTIVYNILKPKISNLILLDGDILRELYGDIGHTIEERRINHIRFSKLSKFLNDQNIHVIGATLSIFPDLREWNRKNIKDYTEVYLKVPLEILKNRDSKGIYSNAMKGKINNVVGIDIDFPEPKNSQLILDNSKDNIDFSEFVEKVMKLKNLKKIYF